MTPSYTQKNSCHNCFIYVQETKVFCFQSCNFVIYYLFLYFFGVGGGLVGMFSCLHQLPAGGVREET